MPKKIPVDPALDHRGSASERAASAPAVNEETVIPIVQEELDVGTRRIETGAGVRVHKTVERKVQVIDEPLVKDELSVERVAVDRYVDEPVAIRYEGDTIIVPVLEEVLVMQKRLLLKEEVRITRRRSEHRAPQRVMLREEHAEVERFGDAAAGPVAEPHASEHAEAAYARAAHGPDGTGTTDPGDDDASLIERRRRTDEAQRSELARTPR